MITTITRPKEDISVTPGERTFSPTRLCSLKSEAIETVGIIELLKLKLKHLEAP